MPVRATVVDRWSVSSKGDGFWREPLAGVMGVLVLISMESTLTLVT